MASNGRAVSLLTTIVLRAISVLGHPVSLIGLFGPAFLVANLNWLSVLAGADGTRAENVELTRILRDPWVFTLSDYVIQSYTLVLAVVLFIITVTGAFVSRYRAKGPNFLKEDLFGVLLLAGCVLSAVLALVAFTNGAFGSPEVVAKYSPKGSPFWGAARFPPWTSPITWGRGIIIVLGIGLAGWQGRINETKD